MRGSSFSGIGRISVGSFFGPIFQATQFEEIIVAVRTTTAIYPAAPSDLGTPTSDTMFLTLYSTGQYLMWTYDASEAQWVMWTEGAAVA